MKNYKDKELFLSNELTLIFIGRDFYRKGGYELTKVFDKLSRRCDESIRLIIVGDINNTWDYTKKISQNYVDEINAIIENNKNIEYYKNIDNSKVIELIKKSHVGILNTWADTYGYSVLEMQACGVPVVTINVRALPEINNSECGWIINLPLNELNEADYFSEKSRKNIKNILESELEDILLGIIKNRDLIKEKGSKAIERIKKYHNPKEYSKKVEFIYKKSI